MYAITCTLDLSLIRLQENRLCNNKIFYIKFHIRKGNKEKEGKKDILFVKMYYLLNFHDFKKVYYGLFYIVNRLYFLLFYLLLELFLFQKYLTRTGFIFN